VDEPCNSGLDENWYTIFEQSIAEQSNNETMCYRTFKLLLESRGPDNRLDENVIWDVSKEMEHLRIMKDIRDELHMINRVFTDQVRVVTALFDSMRTSMFPVFPPTSASNHKISPQQVDKVVQDMNTRIAKIHQLDHEAKMVEQRFKDLLDLKQKQGNLSEARDTKTLVNKADQRARESQFQSNLLFVFTIVTVIFTPLSFVAALLAVPSVDYPHHDNDVSWSVHRIVTGLGAAEATILLPMVIYWVVNKIGHRSEQISNNPVSHRHRLTVQRQVTDRVQIQRTHHITEMNLGHGSDAMNSSSSLSLLLELLKTIVRGEKREKQFASSNGFSV